MVIKRDAAASEYIINRTKTSDENKEEYLKQITICDEIINSTSSKIEKMNNKKRRIAITFANGDIDEVDYQKGRESVEREISLINIDYLKAQEKKEQLEKLINISDTVSYIDILKGMAEEVYSYNELKEMSEIVHTFISNVDLNICDLKGKKTKHIIITSVSGNVYEYLAHYSCGGHHQYRYWKKHKQLVSIFDEWVEINPEILIQRVLGTSKKHPAVIPPVIKRSEKPYYPNGLTEVNNI